MLNNSTENRKCILLHKKQKAILVTKYIDKVDFEIPFHSFVFASSEKKGHLYYCYCFKDMSQG